VTVVTFDFIAYCVPVCMSVFCLIVLIQAFGCKILMQQCQDRRQHPGTVLPTCQDAANLHLNAAVFC